LQLASIQLKANQQTLQDSTAQSINSKLKIETKNLKSQEKQDGADYTYSFIFAKQS
jgi:hypothetical protein